MLTADWKVIKTLCPRKWGAGRSLLWLFGWGQGRESLQEECGRGWKNLCLVLCVTCDMICSSLHWLSLRWRAVQHPLGRQATRTTVELELEVQGRRTSRQRFEQLLAAWKSASMNLTGTENSSVWLEAEHEEGREHVFSQYSDAPRAL